MKQFAIAASLAAGLTAAAAPVAHADPAFGFGISYVFGGSGGGDIALGAKVFSDDTSGDAALSLGLDYKLQSQSFRPNIGVAYMENDWYSDLSVGYDLGAGAVDFGLGAGGWGKF